MKDAITEFTGRRSFLSNFDPAPVYIMVGTIWVKCATLEHGFQASKTLDMRWRMKIIECATPGEAKRMGRRAPRVVYWDDVKTIVMLELLRQKFERARYRDALLRTNDLKLVEGNHWHDNFWGVCVCGRPETSKDANDGCSGGLNWLGRLLERVRTDVRRGQNHSHKRIKV